MGNPKVMVFYLALLPTLLDLTRITVLGYAELVAATLRVLARGLCGLYRARRPRPAALHEPKAIRILNRTTGAMMAGAAAAVASR